MTNRIYNAIGWRLRAARQQALSGFNFIKRALDFSPKEPVKSVSLIVVGRNDNYGGDFSKRLRTTLDWNYNHLPNPELIYIEWNPVQGNESDCNWISERYPNSKCYVVPNEIHRSIAKYPDKMKVMEYFAKNIGLRHATNNWIVLTNADVLIGPDMLNNMKKLNAGTIYGGHYVNIEWDGNPVKDEVFKNKKIIKNYFTAFGGFASTVGNFIMTNKKNWMAATGYDETLKGSRAGVDRNGYMQLKHLGLKTEVIGSHFHLDHPESIINKTDQDSHGDWVILKESKNIPYKNNDGWGFVNYPLKKISEKVWELQPI